MRLLALGFDPVLHRTFYHEPHLMPLVIMLVVLILLVLHAMILVLALVLVLILRVTLEMMP